MTRKLRLCAAVGAGLVVFVVSHAAAAQKQGGILKSYSIDSPASMSIHEEATVVAERPMMGGLQQSRHVRPARGAEQPAIDRARSGDRLVVERGRTELTFPLRQGVKWQTASPSPPRTSNAPGIC